MGHCQDCFKSTCLQICTGCVPTVSCSGESNIVYYNVMFYGISDTFLGHLQSIQNAAAHLLTGAQWHTSHYCTNSAVSEGGVPARGRSWRVLSSLFCQCKSLHRPEYKYSIVWQKFSFFVAVPPVWNSRPSTMRQSATAWHELQTFELNIRHFCLSETKVTARALFHSQASHTWLVMSANGWTLRVTHSVHNSDTVNIISGYFMSLYFVLCLAHIAVWSVVTVNLLACKWI